MALKRLSTGIKELDAMIGGGIPEGDVVLYSGPPGTGKTVACMQFVMDGVSKGEDCIYVASEETRGKLIEHAKLLGFNFKKAVKEKKLEIFQVEDVAFQDPLGLISKLPRDPEQRIKRLTAAIRKWMDKCEGKRLVIDSMIAYTIEDSQHKILMNSELFRELDDLGMTTIFVSELEPDSKAYSREGIMDALADGIVLFNHELEGKKGYKTMEVVKMRDSEIIDEVRRFDIAKKGIKFKK
jgi:KaiC/GvpD/RAD55 family RecA-like ATPase